MPLSTQLLSQVLHGETEAKPEPHFAMPQASSAHDTFWDFVSLMPESMYMQMWVMSDRAIPRSYRMMQGFGVHTFRFVNADGESTFVKFHWNPVAGTHSLDWDEADAIEVLGQEGHALEFVKEQYRHCKPILSLGTGTDLLAKAQIPETLPTGELDPGLLRFEATDINKATAAFAAAIGKHRHFVRQTDPPQI